VDYAQHGPADDWTFALSAMGAGLGDHSQVSKWANKMMFPTAKDNSIPRHDVSDIRRRSLSRLGQRNR
jgi:hypothetical protein